MSALQKKSLDSPDERVELDGISADVVVMGDASIARTLMES